MNVPMFSEVAAGGLPLPILTFLAAGRRPAARHVRVLEADHAVRSVCLPTSNDEGRA